MVGAHVTEPAIRGAQAIGLGQGAALQAGWTIPATWGTDALFLIGRGIEMDTIKRYEEHCITKFFRWSGIIVSISLNAWILPAWIKSTIDDYLLHRWLEFFIGCLYLLILPFFIYIIIATFIEFYTVAVKVELREDRIIGYPWYGKRRFEIRYDEIEIIKDRSNIFPPLAITLMGKNTKMYMSIYVYPLATVVEEIERRAVNLKESRLKRLKRDSSLWLHGKDEDTQS